MVKFIFGRAFSGKTTEVLNRIKREIESGNKNVLLLVPEQASFDYEKSLLHILGEGDFTSVPVLSFTRLFDEVGRLCGGICGKRLSDCDRTILMNRAVRTSKNELELFGKYASNIGFTESIINTLSEFKRCGIDSEMLKEYSATLPKGTLKSKLSDIALLSDVYDGIIKNTFIDPADDMQRLYDMLGDYAYFAEKTVFVDAFKNFTGAQLKVLERIIRQSDEVVFSFCFDGRLSDDAGLFSNVGDTVRKIVSVAERYGVAVEKPFVLGDSFYSRAELSALERVMSVESGSVFCGECEGITLCAADGIYDEAEFAANEIHRLVRQEGYRYRDFVIIARDDGQYMTAVEHMLGKYNIPCFTDRRYDISRMPLTVFLKSAMEAVRNFSSESILKFLKTELAGLAFDEVNALENYVYMWKIDRSDWKKEWDMSPSGFDKFDEADERELSRLNGLRMRAVAPLLSFEKNFVASAENRSLALWKLMRECDVKTGLSVLTQDMPTAEAELNIRSYDAVSEILDSLVHTLGDGCTDADYVECFTLATVETQIGIIPQMLDEVTFGAADRIKPGDPRVVFLLGANQGVFPAVPSNGGVIGGSERMRLLKLGLPITDYSLGFSVDEEYLLYTSLCCARDMVYVSYCESDITGAEAKPSQIVERIEAAFPNCKKMRFGAKSFSLDRIETESSAFSGLMRNFDDGALCRALSEIYSHRSPYRERLGAVVSRNGGNGERLSPQVSERLFGKDMRLSATGIDTYFRCGFSYFCRYGIGAKVIKPAEIDVLQRGTIVHEVLEKLITEYGGKIAELGDDEIVKRTDEITENYLSRIHGIEKLMDNRFMYLVDCIKQLTAEVVCHLRDEFAQSGFVPISCELKIGGDDADIEQAVIKSTAGSVTIRGAVDRVDRFGAYIRIVDYKTGSRKFALPDVLYGLNMQMLIYLYAVMRSERFSDCIPAGVLYLETSKHLGNETDFAMNGLLSNNEEVHGAMEPENEGRFVPKLRKKKDGTFYKSKDYIGEEDFTDVFAHIERLLKKMNVSLLKGDISVSPTDGRDKDACKYCDYACVCGIENRPHKKVPAADNETVIAAMREEEENV